MSTERLQKLLARSGIASRRAAERLIEEGRVRVNGKVTKELGTKADLRKDRIEIDGRRLVEERPAYYLLHKPREMVTTLSDPEGRATVADLLKHVPERVFPVGRLDYHTSGALLLTNDGEMAQALLHPKKLVPKTYIAKFKGELTLKNLEALRSGIVLDDGHKTRKADLFVVNVEGGNTWLQLTITEGKNRQVHRMGEAIGHRVMRLSRIAFAGITTEGLRPEEYRPLSNAEIADLKKDYLNPSKRAKFEDARARRRAAQAPDEQPAPIRPLGPPRKGEAPRRPMGPRRPGGPRKFEGPSKFTGPRKPEGQRELAGQREFTGPRKYTGPRKPEGQRESTGQREFTGPRKYTGPRKPEGQRDPADFRKRDDRRATTGPRKYAGPRKAEGPRKYAGPRKPEGQRDPADFRKRDDRRDETGPRKFAGPHKAEGPRKYTGPRKPEGQRDPSGPRAPTRRPRKTRPERETTS